MMDAATLKKSAEGALARMKASGFDQAQVTAAAVRQDEVNINLSEPSLMRSTEARKLTLVGIVDGRRAATEVTDLRDEAVRESVELLLAAARSAPQDAAYKVSTGQHARIVQGPQAVDVDVLTSKAREILEYCARETPRVMIGEALAAHTLVRSHTVTTGGSDLESEVGHLSLSIFGTARDGAKVSSFAATGGDAHELEARNATAYFGIDELLKHLEQSIHTRALDAKFEGDVVLAPQAVGDLVEWFLAQLCDAQLISGSSLYRDRVGQAVASKLLTLRSRFDAPGVTALTMDAFVAKPVEVLAQGVLKTLTPSLYGSLKTGLPHVPTALGGWELVAGDTARDDLVAQTKKGALVGRLSMGNPASNGDFAGVIKNSFAIDGGKLGGALSETMITGNVSRMLHEVIAVSRERLDTGAMLLPWVRIGNLHFS